MRTETEMLDAISQIAKSLQVEAVALSGSCLLYTSQCGLGRNDGWTLSLL